MMQFLEEGRAAPPIVSTRSPGKTGGKEDPRSQAVPWLSSVQMSPRESARPVTESATKHWSIPSKLTLAMVPITVVALLLGLLLIWNLAASDTTWRFSKIGAIRPGDGPDLRVDSDLCEQVVVPRDLLEYRTPQKRP